MSENTTAATAAQEAAKVSTSKTPSIFARFSQWLSKTANRVVDFVVGAAAKTKRGVIRGAKASWRGTQWFGATVYDGGAWTGHKLWSGTKFTGRFAWAGVKFIGTGVSLAGAVVFHGVGWLASIGSAGLFYVGVGCAVVGIILATPYTASSYKTTVVKQEPAIRVVKTNDTIVTEDPSFELFYRDAIANEDLATASYWFGKWQARLAKVDGVNTNQAWGLLNKEVRSPGNKLHISKVRQGWDEELGASKVDAT